MIDVGLALPFTLGIVTAVNPCGFAMLPTWLGYFIGRDTSDRRARPEQVVRGLVVSLVLAGAFVMVFGLLGLAVTHLVSEEAVARRTPWATVVIGAALIPYGVALLAGRKSRLPLPQPRSGPRTRELWSVFWFGASYAVVSVGCAAPLFLLHVAGSFSREGVAEGLIVYLAFAAGMAAVLTSLTLSLAVARGGLVRHLRRLLPHMDRIGAFALLAGGAYLVVYGVYEIRILRDPTTASNPVVDTVTRLQTHLTNWAAEVGGTRVGLALWLLVGTLAVWGAAPAMARTTRRWLLAATAAAWVLAEVAVHRGELVVLPVARVVLAWPARMANWVAEPARWAVPLEVLLTAAALLTVATSAWARLAGPGRRRAGRC